MHSAAEQRRQAFSVWLRTGRLPSHSRSSGRELKFNPWHDTRNGRFTFSEAGRYYDSDGTGPPASRGRKPPPILFKPDPAMAPFNTPEEIDAWAAALRKEHGNERGYPEAIEAQRRLYLLDLARNKPAPPPAPSSDALGKVADFATGFAEGAVDVAKATATGIYSLATTNPATSAQNIEFGIAQAVDGAIAAEDTPAYVQLKRAKRAIADASAHDIGHALGSFAGNVALTVAPGAIVSKVSTAARAKSVVNFTAVPIRTKARLGTSTSSNYRATFFAAYPTLKQSVVVHHAVEKQVLKRYPGILTQSEMHSLENLRGIPREINSALHLRTLRNEWDEFYLTFNESGSVITKESLLDKATDIDVKYGSQFNPPR